jgi:DNA-binding MurR/RpiR family transcriptional regulator
MYSFQSMDAKQRYDALLVENPEVFMRFSSQDIALFLGIEPATLSRIRKEKNKYK